jgi:hypothetical protein
MVSVKPNSNYTKLLEPCLCRKCICKKSFVKNIYARFIRPVLFFMKMINTSFLDKIAQVLIENYLITIRYDSGFANKRAKIFLIEALQRQVDGNILLLKLLVSRILFNISGIRTVDPSNCCLNFL